MNEFGFVGLNEGTPEEFQHYLLCTLQTETLIALIRESKCYEFVGHILPELQEQFLCENKKMAHREYLRPLVPHEQPTYQLYIDLLVAGKQNLCKVIRKKCPINDRLFIELAVERNVDVREVDPKRFKRHFHTFFRAILMYDSLSLFLKCRIPALTYFGRRTFISNAVFHFSEKILKYEVENGAKGDIFINIFRTHSLNDAQKAFLCWMCTKTNCTSILNKEFDYCPDKKLKFLLELGAKPSEAQKESLRKESPRMYEQLFAEEV